MPSELGDCVECYAQAGIPAYLVADREHDEVLLRTDPSVDVLLDGEGRLS